MVTRDNLPLILGVGVFLLSSAMMLLTPQPVYGALSPSQMLDLALEEDDPAPEPCPEGDFTCDTVIEEITD